MPDVTMEIHKAKELIVLLGVQKTIVELIHPSKEWKEALVNNIDKMRTILLDSVELKQEIKHG